MERHLKKLDGHSCQVASSSGSNPFQIEDFPFEGFRDNFLPLKSQSRSHHFDPDSQDEHGRSVQLPSAGEERSLEEIQYNKEFWNRYDLRLQESTVPQDQLNSQFARAQISPNQGVRVTPDVTEAEIPWLARRGNLSEMERVIKTVKGILNKLTTEKFDVLKGQLIDSGITTAYILKGVVSMIFEKAVLEPTYCSMYALLCSDLIKKLPRFPSDEPGGKQVWFLRILLNICQETFEGALNLRKEIRQMTAPEQEMEHVNKEEMIKLRTLGNIRLIWELFKQRMIPERIMLHMAVVLLTHDGETCPSEDKLEAICQIFSNVGKQLDESQRSRRFNDLYFKRLEELTTNPQLAPRLRFMVLDVLELRERKWCPRPKEVSAPPTSLPSSFASGIEENRMALDPRLSVEPVPPATRSNPANLHWKIVYLLEEYFCVPILDEALRRVKKLKEPKYHHVIVTEAIALALEKNPPCVELVSELLESLFIKNILTVEDIRIGCHFYGSALNDIGIDLPKAPNNFGEIIGKLVLDGIMNFKVVKEVLKLIEDDKFRTAIIGAALRSIESSLSEVSGAGRW